MDMTELLYTSLNFQPIYSIHIYLLLYECFFTVHVDKVLVCHTEKEKTKLFASYSSCISTRLLNFHIILER